MTCGQRQVGVFGALAAKYQGVEPPRSGVPEVKVPSVPSALFKGLGLTYSDR